MISDSNKFPSMLRYEISPLIIPKINQFNEIQNSSNYKNKIFSELKININKGEKNLGNSNKQFKMISSESKFNSFDPSFTTVSSFNKSKSLLNSKINFNSRLFGNLNKCQNHFTKKKKIKFQTILKRENIFINEVNINNFHLINFPLININEEEIKINYLSKLIASQKYFIIKEPSSLDLCNFKDESLKTLNIPFSILKANNLYFYEGSLNAFEIIRKFYFEIKQYLKEIEENFINKKNKIYNEKNILKLELLIRNCNMFTSFILQKFKNRINIYKKLFNEEKKEEEKKSKLKERKKIITNKKRKKLKKIINKEINIFKCEFCKKIFGKGQALGGHLSQSHPQKSEKYKIKIMIRNKRKDRRDLIAKCRKSLIEKYGYNYDELIKDPKKKIIIRKIIKEHNLEYKYLLLGKKKKCGFHEKKNN